MQQKIVISGGPGTGKSTIINSLIDKDYYCLEEVSRQVTLEAQKKGVDQLFVSDPLLFSNLLLKARITQYNQATESKKKQVFFDRGIPDVFAYLNFVDTSYPNHFIAQSKTHKYATIFITPPWEEIHTVDNERYENFEQAKIIHTYLLKAYKQLGYTPIIVPIGNVENRVDFILKNV